MPMISFSQIPTIAQAYTSDQLQPASELHPRATSRFNSKISLIRTDITKLAIDAIVNAANNSLLGGGGVDGAIHRAAGPELVDECETLGGCDTGSAKITGAYELVCKKVIHAVGPIYGREKRREDGRQERLLKSCYTTSLDLAVENECRTIAFSALSTGVYGYPSDEAAAAAISAVKEWLEEDDERAEKMERIVFCQFMLKDQEAYEHFIPYFFPPQDQVPSKVEDSADAPRNDLEESNTTENGEGSSATREKMHTEPATDRQRGAEAQTDTEEKQLPELPNVPTSEPQQEGQPEAKKAKLEHDGRE